MKSLIRWAACIALLFGLPVAHVSSQQSGLASFDLSVSATDATSVKLHWPPVDGATDYVVSRDGAVVGTTVGALGYFTEFDLQPARSYSYSVAARAAGTVIAQSNTTSALTGGSMSVRTHYVVLAIAFNPGAEDLLTEKVYLDHRIQFLRLASLNSAVIELYNGGIVSSAITPDLAPGSTWVDYTRLVTRRDLPGMNGLSIVDLIERGDIDHVWVVKSPVDFYENALIGNRKIQGNGKVGPNTWMPIPVASSRSFFVNAYLPDERSWDAYAHMVEGIMTSISEGWGGPAGPGVNPFLVYTHDRTSYALVEANLNGWEQFELTDGWNGASPVQYASPGHSNVGSSHFPPTTPRECADYCYYDLATWQRYVDSWAYDWLDYPAFGISGSPRKINGYEFGAFNHYAQGDASYSAAMVVSPELHPSFTFASESYHQWWFAHLPHSWRLNPLDRISNWWPHIFDFNRFDGAPTDYGPGDLPHVQSVFPPIGGEYGTNDPNADNWGYWHSENGFSPGAKVATLASVIRPAPLRHLVNGGDTIFEGAFDVNHVLKVSVENAQNWEDLGSGRNDVFYPTSRNNCCGDLRGLAGIEVSIMLGLNADLVVDTNPVIRLCRNPGDRIEFVPRKDGAYANLFHDAALMDTDGWYNFYIPAAGDATWEKNVIGYVDPTLSPADQQAARAQLEQNILNDLNYVEISIRTTTSRSSAPDDIVTYYIDGLRLLTR
jgi:hypothetical protein